MNILPAHYQKYLLILPALVLIGSAFGLSTVEAATGINRTINFQGKVVNADGTNVTNGDYDFEFNIYTVDSGGSPIWTESWDGANQVTVTDGIFRVSLGTHTSLPGSVDFNTDNIYLGITFNNDADGEMSPRVRFSAVPYAFNAEKVAGLTVTNTTGTLTIPNSKTIQFADAFTTSGANPLTLTTTASTNVTLPTSGTLFSTATTSTAGDIIYASANNTMGLLNRGSDGDCLVATTTSIQWSNCVAANSLDFAHLENSLVLDASTDISVTGSNVFSLTNSGSGDSFVVYDDGSDSTPFVINNVGNVGIGFSSPGALLEVGNGTDGFQVSSSADLTFVDADGAASITGPAGGELLISAGVSRPLTLTANASAVWSTSNGLLTLTGDDGLTLNATSTAGIIGNIPDNLADAFDLQQGTNNYININTTDSSERVTIGNSSATNTGVTLDINGTGTLLLPDFSNCTALETSSGVLTCGSDDTGGALTWNSIQAPTGNASLAMDADTTAWTWGTITTQNAFSFNNTSVTHSSGDLVTIDQVASMNDASNVTGNLLDIARSLTIDIGGTRAITVSSPVVSITDNCTQGASDTCTHSGNVLALTQSFTTASGAALAISNSGTGAGLSVDLANGSNRTNGILIDQTGGGTTTNAIHITDSGAGGITDSILVDGGAPTGNYLNTATIDITAAGALTGVTGITLTSGAINVGNGGITNAGSIAGATTITASSAIAANGGITFDQTSDTIGSHTAGGTILMNSNILQDIGNTGTDFIASTGALTLAGVLTANGGVTVSGGQNLSMSSGTGLFTQTHAVTTDATADSHTITLSAGGTGSSGTLRGLVVSQSDTGTNGVFDSLGYFVNLKTPETTTNGILIEQNAGSGTLSNALHITNTAGTLTDAILIDGTAASGNILNTGSLDITGAGAITGATGLILSSGSINIGNGGITNAGSIAGATTITASSAIAANGGITFDASSDTIGSFTAGGTILMNSNILQDIGNTGTDFIASTGALTLAGVLTANGGITVSGGQNFSMSSGTGVFTQTHAPTTDATADANTITLSAGGTGSSNVLRGLVVSQSDTATTGVYDSLVYIQNLKTPETTTNGLFIEHNAASGTMSNGINITNTAGTMTTGLFIAGTYTNLIDTPSFDVSNAGTVTLAASQSYTGSGAITLSSGGAGALTLDSASNSLIIAASDTTLSRTASGTYSIDLVDSSTTTLALINSGAGVAQLQIDSLTAAACDVKADTSGFLSCGTDAGAAASPFGSAGGVVTKTTSSDQVRFTMAQAGDYGLLIDASTVPTVDLLQLTNSGQGVTSTSGVDAASITYVQATNATAITGSAIDINLTASGDASDVIRGITINNITAGSSTETGLYVGTGYDRDIELADTSPTIVLGGDTAITDGTNTLLTIDDQGTYGFLRLSDKGGAGDPASCTSGDIYFNDTDNTFKGCTSTNTWEAFDNGADSQLATATLTETTVAGSATFVTGSTAAVTPTTTTGDIYVTVDLWTKSLSNTDQTITVQIRTTSGTTCGGSLLASATAALTSANASNGPGLFAAYLSVDPGTSSQSFSVCALSTTASGASVGGLIAVQVIDSGADLAEFYTTNDPTLAEGDVVALDPALKTGVKKTTSAYDRNVLGIVSTKPGIAIGSVDKEGVGARPVALAGRVPVKVSTQNGPIKAGDLLTSSSTPGVAMKATDGGFIIGKAMTEFNGLEEQGMVLVFVNNTFVAPEHWLEAMDLSSSGLIKSVSDKPAIGELWFEDNQLVLRSEQGETRFSIDDKGNAYIAGNLVVEGEISGLSALEDSVSDVQKRLSILEQEATQSAPTASMSASVDELTVTNHLFLKGVLTVLESVSTAHLIVSDYAEFVGVVLFKSDVAIDGRLTLNNDAAGSAIIKMNHQEVAVVFAKPYETTPMITASITLDSLMSDEEKSMLSAEAFAAQEASQSALEQTVLNGDLRFIVTRRTAQGFVIKLNRPAPADLKFSWNATAVKSAKVFESLEPGKQLEALLDQEKKVETGLLEIDELVQEGEGGDKGREVEDLVAAVVGKEGQEKMIQISETSTGFLRVRESYTTDSEQISEVLPGEQYKVQKEYTNEQTKVTWYEITLSTGEIGWVSSLFVKDISDVVLTN